MASSDTNDIPMVQLATRIPRQLHRDLKLYCVEHETSVMKFVTAALTERLTAQTQAPNKVVPIKGKRRSKP